MKVLGTDLIEGCCKKYSLCRGPLRAWYAEACVAVWKRPSDVTAQYPRASILRNCRVVFNIAGNKYRLVVGINYELETVVVRFVGTHEEYDRINAETV